MKRWLLVLLTLLVLLPAPLRAQGEKPQWPGVDKTVVEKFAKELGREPQKPFLDIQGDMLLFLFTLSGCVGGFVMGYFWHKVFVAGKKDGEKPD
jgi:cobalt/nickel transport protein